MTPPTASAAFFRPLPRLGTWRLLGALAIVLTIVLSLVPMPPSPVHVEGGDKIEHLLGYFGLAAWHVQLVANARALAWCALGLLLLGAGIEVRVEVGNPFFLPALRTLLLMPLLM